MKAVHFLSSLAVLLLSAVAVAGAQTDSGGAGTNAATLPPVAYLQFEQGFVQANGSPGVARQFSINQTAKLAVTTRVMAEFFSQPFASTESAGENSRDAGDLQAGAQLVLLRGSGLRP